MNERAQPLVDAAVELVDEAGMGALSIRTVPQRSGRSIGAVQHHFPTKQALLVAVFGEVVRRVTDRVTAPASGSPRTRLRRLLNQLVPLDADRLAEARVVAAFSAAAATDPELAAIQRDTLATVRDGISACLAHARGENSPSASTRRRAVVALAAVDGLALHAVSSGGALTSKDLRRAVDELVDRLLT